MRKCSRCLAEKSLEEFYPKRRKKARDGYQNICKGCAKTRALEWFRANRKRHRENTKNWWVNNKEIQRKSVAKWAKANHAKWMKKNTEWRKANPEKVAVTRRKYRKAHPQYELADKAKRRAKKLLATPQWANTKGIKAIYIEAARLTRETGVQHHVDHAIPLRHPLVQGLHCEANLQILTKLENIRKNNRVWPQMP